MRPISLLIRLAVLATVAVAVAVPLDKRKGGSSLSRATKLPRDLNGGCYAVQETSSIFISYPPVPIVLSPADDLLACSQICAFENGGRLASPFVGLYLGGPLAGRLGCECGKVKTVGLLGMQLEGPGEHAYCNFATLGAHYGGATIDAGVPVNVFNANLGHPQSLRSLHRNGACYTGSTADAWATRVVPALGPVRNRVQQLAGCTKLCNPHRGDRSGPIVGLASAGPHNGTRCWCIGASTARLLGPPAEGPDSHKYCSGELGSADATYVSFFDAPA